MKLVASLIAGILLGAASVAVAAPLYWKKSGTRYVCTGYPNNVSCTDAFSGGPGRPLHIGNYEVAIEGRWVTVKYAEQLQNGVPVDQKTIFRCNRREPLPARNCTLSP
jgi:hypothetical protein